MNAECPGPDQILRAKATAPPLARPATGSRVVDHFLQNAPEANVQTKAVALECAWGKMSDETFDRLVSQHAAKRQSEEAVEGLALFAG